MVKRRSRLGENGVWPYLLLLPALIVMVSVVIVPIINAVSMSFQYYNLNMPKRTTFVGLDNYIKILGTAKFRRSLWLTVIWVIFGVGGQFLFGFLLALLLNQNYRGRGVVRAVSLIPWVTPGVLIALMWSLIMDGNYGVLNDILLRLGVVSEKVAFLARKDTALPSVIVTIIWQGIPFFAIMLLAGLQGISHDLYEAADIDGATRMQKLFYVTIPSLRNTIFVTTMLRIIWVANSVDIIANMTDGGPANATLTLSVNIYKEASTLNMGYASAMAILLMLVLLAAAIPYLHSMFKEE
ncbi:MAG: sugar ABC transporter permease, partial [Clostridia bacterium]|nr:sugar ABC transporter permease [Clostridia bacterium]